MRRVVSLLALTAALGGGVGPVAAQAPLTADQADVRCLMVMQVVARDPKVKEQGAKGVIFYTGRLSGRGPVSRIEAIVKAEAAKMSPQQAKTELQRCSKDINARGQELNAVNQRLAASARPAPAKK